MARRPGNRTAAATLAMAGGLCLGGCLAERAGVGLPPGLVYQRTTVPIAAPIPEEDAGIPIPSERKGSRFRTHRLRVGFPFPTPPWLTAFSYGWGAESKVRAFETGQSGGFGYADVEHLSILSIYTRTTVTGYDVRGELLASAVSGD